MSTERRPLWARWLQLVTGLFGWALAIALMIRSGLGLGPWDAFHLGLHLTTGVSVGVASILTGLAVLVGSLAVGVRPGFGTLANMVLIGLFTDILLPWIPDAAGWRGGVAYFAAGVLLAGLCSGLYIGARLGSGPRDGLMLALSARYGWPVRRVRTAIELTALGFGWVMGGTVGVGTVVYALTSGPSVQWGLRLFGVLPARQLAEPVPPPEVPERRAA